MSMAKRISCLFLVVALMLSMSLTTFAAETHEPDGCCTQVAAITGTPEAEPQHVHTWGDTPRLVYVRGQGKYVSADGCYRFVQEWYSCTCGAETMIRDYYWSTVTPHLSVAYHAVCDGNTQTVNRRCQYCLHDTDVIYVACPAGPHTGSCDSLICSVPGEDTLT